MANPQQRHELAVLARKGRRVLEYPHDWHPENVEHPSGLCNYTWPTAWEFIADLLDSGHPLEAVTLENPKGATGCVFHVDPPLAKRRLYIKFRQGSGCIIGRSFHYDK